jgi:hypothetical protein
MSARWWKRPTDYDDHLAIVLAKSVCGVTAAVPEDLAVSAAGRLAGS